MSTGTRKQLEACKKAEDEGFEIVQSDPWHLLLDLDSQEQLKQYETLLPMLDNLLGAVEQERWKSKSGNDHVLVRLTNPLDVKLYRPF